VIKTPLEHKIVRSNGISFHMVQAGPEDGPLVILLHGFPEFWYGWRHQIDTLVGSGFRVWLPDQRGYNLSDKPTEIRDYRIDNLVEDVVGFIKSSHRQDVRLVGHDWGGYVAWWTALKHPDLIHRMAILNMPHPYVFLRTLRKDGMQKLMSAYIGFFQMPTVPEALFRAAGSRLAMMGMRLSGKNDTFSRDDAAAYQKAWTEPDAAQSMLNWYRAAVKYPAEAPADWRVKVPTMLIWGSQDRFLHSKMAQPSIDLCDDGRLEIIKDATHWVQHDEADTVNRLLIEWLSV